MTTLLQLVVRSSDDVVVGQGFPNSPSVLKIPDGFYTVTVPQVADIVTNVGSVYSASTQTLTAPALLAPAAAPEAATG